MAKATRQPATEPSPTPGQTFVISTPNPAFSDTRAGVQFSHGIGRTKDPRSAFELQNLGYRVTDSENGQPVTLSAPAASRMPRHRPTSNPPKGD